MISERLDELLAAEAFFKALLAGEKKLPNSVSSQEYTPLVDSVRSLAAAYEVLERTPDADARLRAAQSQGLLRPRRHGLSNRVLPLKEAVKSWGAVRVEWLARVVSDPRSVLHSPTLIDRYDFELAYRVLQAYNSLRDLDAGNCVQEGSVLCSADVADLYQ